MSSSPRDQTTQELLQQAAQGDESAWRTIVDEYSPRVFGLIRSKCGNDDLAAEITQSAFATVAEKIGAYDESGRFEQWLFRIAVNRLRDEMRRRGRQATPVDDQTLVGLAGAADPARDDPSGGPSKADDRVRLKAAMERLSDIDQRVIHLRHVGGLSFRQIAEVLSEPQGTVLARHFRALKKLRELMDAKPPESGSDRQ